MTRKLVCLFTVFSAVFLSPFALTKGGSAETLSKKAKTQTVRGAFVRSGMNEFGKVVVKNGKKSTKTRLAKNSEMDFGKALKRAFPRYPRHQIQSAEQYSKMALPIAKKYQVDWKLVTAVMAVESNFNPKALSPVGARGLMQVMPATAKMYKVSAKDLYNPKSNIEAGVQHLKRLKKLYPRNLELVIAAYNAGEGNVKKHRGIPPFEETQNYVKRVKGYYNVM